MKNIFHIILKMKYTTLNIFVKFFFIIFSSFQFRLILKFKYLIFKYKI